MCVTMPDLDYACVLCRNVCLYEHVFHVNTKHLPVAAGAADLKNTIKTMFRILSSLRSLTFSHPPFHFCISVCLTHPSSA